MPDKRTRRASRRFDILAGNHDGSFVTLVTLASKEAVDETAADRAADVLRRRIGESGSARLVAATGSSQIGLLERLVAAPDIDWKAVDLFHLDEYVGLEASHPASFQRFLIDRLIAPTGMMRTHLLDGGGDPKRVMETVGRKLVQQPVDLLLCGVGENGHLAFNEPPADFDRRDPYFVVTLDEVSRRQQVGERWFTRIEDVPRSAVTMSIQQMLSARDIVCVATGTRKAAAIRACFGGDVTPMAPASILRTHPRATVFLDDAAAALLPGLTQP